MNLSEAMILLEKNNITSSKQMVRRWIRQGKIDAKLRTKKEGYDIDSDSLMSFIKVKKADNFKPVGYEAGYKDGYKDGYSAAQAHSSSDEKKGENFQ